MNYFDTLSFHLVSVLFMTVGVSLYTTDQKNTGFKVLAIVGTFITMVTGLMLYNRFGMPLKGPYPIWIMVKSVIWLSIIFALVFVSIKAKKKTRLLIWPIISLLGIAICISVYKPL